MVAVGLHFEAGLALAVGVAVLEGTVAIIVTG
jgi:hypothetical protein